MTKLTIGKIAKIRNALQVIQVNANLIPSASENSRQIIMVDIIKQTERIDELLLEEHPE